jgi:hypothetical protein
MNPDILFFILKKSQQTNPLQVPQWGPYRERYLHTGHFYISLDIFLYIKGPKKRVSLHVPKSGASLETTPVPEPYLTYLLGSPVKE